VYALKARLKFSKTGSMKFIGHLDVMRYFQKAFRRAEISVQYSQGYSPHQLISFAAPLGVGLTSESEYLDMQLSETLSSKEMIDKINSAMVEGIKVESFRALTDDSKNAMSIVAAADYSVSVKEGYFVCEDFLNKFNDFINQDQIIILKKSKKSEKEVDIKPFIYHTAFDRNTFDKLVGKANNSTSIERKNIEKDENSTHVELNSTNASTDEVFMQLATGSVNNLKPELVMEAFCNQYSIEHNPFAFQVHRMEIYADMGDENKRELVTLENLGTEII
jgi:radical SAM-linked protein